jgi:N,N'-diacetyllegionaminate synthase
VDEVNLNCMATLRDTFNCQVGYSDHTEGIAVSIAAVALGAEIIEKHLTLDRTMEGPDHRASLEPYELQEMIKGIRQTEAALGTSEKKPSPSELRNLVVARKSIVAKKAIRAGDVFTVENLTTKRPGDGIPASSWYRMLGQKAPRAYVEDEQIKL